ncbi:MAG: ribosomal RNA small subunit methyltransferase A [Clostridiales bacterium]|nr:ribosomal RNA small subunit methyltransferase A [Clostridiales bacterium]
MENGLKQLIRKHGFSFKKAFGQNFLTDENLLDEIVESAGVTDSDTVLEIGCGAGALTRALAKKAKRVIGYEIDKTLKPLLDDVLDGFNNVEIVFKDVMKEKIADIDANLGKFILVANLPYYITTPIIMQFLEVSNKVSSMVIMVQEEVAYRLCAKEGTADYGAITVAIDLRGDAEIVKSVPREMFTPPPNVDSAVVKITIDNDKFKDLDLKSIRNVVKAGFGNRRKMLVNNLMMAFKLNRSQAEAVLNSSNVSLTARGEELSSEDYIRLSETIKKVQNEK